MKVSGKLIKFLKSILLRLKKNNKAKVNESFNNNKINGNNLFSNNRKIIIKNTYHKYGNDISRKNDTDMEKDIYVVKKFSFLKIIKDRICLFVGMFLSLIFAVFVLEILFQKYYFVEYLQKYGLFIAIVVCLLFVIIKILNYKINKIAINTLNIIGNIIICLTPFSIFWNKTLYIDIGLIENSSNYAYYISLLIGCLSNILLLFISIQNLFYKNIDEFKEYEWVVIFILLMSSGFAVKLILFIIGIGEEFLHHLGNYVIQKINDITKQLQQNFSNP